MYEQLLLPAVIYSISYLARTLLQFGGGQEKHTRDVRRRCATGSQHALQTALYVLVFQ